MIKQDLRSTKRWVLIVFVVVYAVFVLSLTVLFRKIGANYKPKLLPLWSYGEIFHGNISILKEVLLNVVLFIPLGFLLGSYFGNGKSWKVVFLCCLFSISIELLQLFTQRGFCEVDDVIHNALGSMVGYGVWSVLNGLLHITDHDK